MNKFYIGMDIGGTNIRVAVLDEKKKFISNVVKMPFKKSGTAEEDVENNICIPLMQVIKNNDLDFRNARGLGLSLAAIFDRNSGTIIKWPNNQLWNSFPLKNYLMNRLNIAVVMEDDANCAAIGEHMTGAGKGCANFAYITISTGIGCGLILNDRLYTGAYGCAGEIGHVRVENNGPLCTCGMKGCLQAVASGPALYKRSIELAGNAGIGSEDIPDLIKTVHFAQEGADWAVTVFEEAGKHIAYMIAYLVMILDLPLIVLGGGVLQAKDVILNPIRRNLASHLEQFKKKIEVRTAALGDNSGIVGAINLIYKNDGV